MHILYIHQYFATPSGKTGTRSYEFARRWTSAGHRVTMLTTTAQLTSEDLAAAKGRTCKRFSVEGIDIFALSVPYKQQMRLLRRVFAFMRFSLLSCLLGLKIRRVDVVYTTSTPLTVGIPAIVIKLLKRTPYVFEVRDQWPKVPIDLGILKNPVLKYFTAWLEKTIYRHSSAIVALSPGMRDGIRSVIGEQKNIQVIPNCCDLAFFNNSTNRLSIRKKMGWQDKCIFLHMGAMGRVNNLGFILDAAQKLRGRSYIHFVLLGDGRAKDDLQIRAQSLGLHNVSIISAVSKRRLPEYVVASDVGLVTINCVPVLENNSANKFFDYLSAGMPVLLNYCGWQADLLESNHAGLGCPLCNLDEFVEKVQRLANDDSLRHQMGANAQILAEEKFNRDDLARQALDLLISLGEKK